MCPPRRAFSTSKAGASELRWRARRAALNLLAIAAPWMASTTRAEEHLTPKVDWNAQRLPAAGEINVIWVGHSLVEATASSSWGPVSLMTVVGRLAASRGLRYKMTDHTLFGSPLSALWRGSPHSYNRDAGQMVPKREALEREAATYNAIVLTEAIPLAGTMRFEYSSYYLRRFYCTLLNANPKARVYLYQTWVHLQGSQLSETKQTCTAGFDWQATMRGDRSAWESLADAASKPSVGAPSLLARFGFPSQTDAGCTKNDPIFMIPVGSAFLALAERLQRPDVAETFKWPDGRVLKLTDLVQNPIIGNPPCGGTTEVNPLRVPSAALDDIHPSLVGIYLSALVHFSVLYRQTPLALPAPDDIGAPLARALQCLAWTTVLKDQRTGVAGKPDC